MAKHKLMVNTATLDVAPFDGPNKTCANCDEGGDEVDLIHFELSGSDGYNTTFVICSDCIGEMLENVTAGKLDSVNVNTPS